MKRLVSAMAGRLGYTIIPTWQMEGYAGVRHLRRVLNLLSIDLVIDVGANTGQFRDMLRGQAGYQGQIVSFEPVPHLAKALAVRAKTDPLWDVEPRALGATPGIAIFNVMENTEFSSFLSPRHDDVDIFRKQNNVRERVNVDVTTLDIFLKGVLGQAMAKKIYVKLDTQGFDLEVLKGGEASLMHFAALQIEASVRPIYEHSPRYQDVMDHLLARDYIVSGFFPNNDGHFPQLIEFDCHMIRRELVT